MKKLLTLILFLFISQTSYSQITGGSAISAGTLAWKFGVGIGLAYGFTSGTLNCECAYEFENLKGPGFYVNGLGSKPLDYNSDFIFGLGFQILTLSSTVQMARLKSVEDEPVPVNVNMESNADVDISSLYLTLGYKRKLSDGFFFTGGLDMHLVTDCNLAQDETIKDERFTFASSGKTTGPIYEGDLKDYNNIQCNLKVGLSYDIVFDYKWLITPNVSLSYPLLKFTSSSSARLMVLTLGINILYMF